MSIFKGTTEPKSIKIGIPHDDYSAMQGPCPSGFHIPTKDEWETVCNIGISLGIWTSSSGDNAKIYLKMPYAGYRSYSNSNLSGQGSYGFYWSCTWYNSSNVYGLLMRSNAFTASGMQSSPNGMSIRPFKDIPTVPDSSWTSLYSDKVYHNSTLGLISLSSDGNTWVTIADKNLGATTVYNNGDTLSEANCGKYYQRGNNYGFPRTGSVTTSSTQVNASTYGPGNYYSSSTFVTRSSSPYSWDSSDNGNLRGGVTGMVQKQDTDIKKVYLGSTQVRPILPYLCFTANTAGSTVQLYVDFGTPAPVTLEKSTDGDNWSSYTIGDTIILTNIGDKVYLRNTSETTTGFNTSGTTYKFAMSGSIAGSGDLSTLINKNGTTTITSDYCFSSLFYGCTALTTPPKLTATTLTAGCYANLFRDCTALNAIPALKATAFPDFCCSYAFSGCSSIKLSSTQTGEYQKPYRIPTTGTGTEGSYSLSSMFKNTGGTFTGTPTVNTTYYTSNTIV